MRSSLLSQVGPFILLGNALLAAAQNGGGFSIACQNIALSSSDPTMLTATCNGLSTTVDLNTCLGNTQGLLDGPGSGFTSTCDTSSCKIETNQQGIIVYNCACDNGQGFKPNGGGFNLDTIVSFDKTGILSCGDPTTNNGDLQFNTFSDTACSNSIQSVQLKTSGGAGIACQSLGTSGGINSVQGILNGTPCNVILFDNPTCQGSSISTVDIESGQCVAADNVTNNFVNAVAAQVLCGTDTLDGGNVKLRKRGPSRRHPSPGASKYKLWTRDPSKAKEL